MVQKIGDSPDGMSYFLRVKLFANFSTLREVSVITNYSSPERRMLEDLAENPVKQDSVLISQEKQKQAELEKAEKMKAEKEKVEIENIANTDTVR